MYRHYSKDNFESLDYREYSAKLGDIVFVLDRECAREDVRPEVVCLSEADPMRCEHQSWNFDK